jgi:mRNA interferase MazF
MASIYVRDVSENALTTLKVRAARGGQSLQGVGIEHGQKPQRGFHLVGGGLGEAAEAPLAVRAGDPMHEPRGSKPAKRRPVLVIQADPFNASRLNTTLAAVITSNTGLAAMPGNVFIPATATGLSRDSVVNVTALVTLDKTDLDPAVGQLPASLMHEVDRGLRRVLGL